MKQQASKIELIPSSPEYAERWLRWRSEPNAVRFNPMKQSGVEELRERMATFQSDLSTLVENGTNIFFIASDSEPVGVATLRNVSCAENLSRNAFAKVGCVHCRRKCGVPTGR